MSEKKKKKNRTKGNSNIYTLILIPEKPHHTEKIEIKCDTSWRYIAFMQKFTTLYRHLEPRADKWGKIVSPPPPRKTFFHYTQRW